MPKQHNVASANEIHAYFEVQAPSRAFHGVLHPFISQNHGATSKLLRNASSKDLLLEAFRKLIENIKLFPSAKNNRVGEVRHYLVNDLQSIGLERSLDLLQILKQIAEPFEFLIVAKHQLIERAILVLHRNST